MPDSGSRPVYVPRRIAQRVELSGREGVLSLLRWGPPDPSPIVMLHGWMDCAAAWQLLVDELPDDWPLLALDWPGYGESARRAAHYWFPEHLAELDWVLEQVVPEGPARVIGHSMGGTVASMYAGVRPGRLGWLVNMEGYGMPELSPEELPALVASWLDALHRPPAARRYEDLEELAVAVQRANPCLPMSNARFLARVWTRPIDGGHEMRADPRHQMRSPARYNRAELEACWARVRTPQLLLYGEQSGQARRTLKKDTPEELRALSPSLAIASIPSAGHLLPYEQPQRVAQAIVDFVASLA